MMKSLSQPYLIIQTKARVDDDEKSFCMFCFPDVVGKDQRDEAHASRLHDVRGVHHRRQQHGRGLAHFKNKKIMRSSTGGVGYVTVFNTSATWAATFRLRGYECMLVFFLCFRNPPNSDMDYSIFNVRTWPFVCVRIHTGVGHTDSESAQPF